jgi:hypothetical protein
LRPHWALPFIAATLKTIVGDGFPRLGPQALSSSGPSINRRHSPAHISALTGRAFGVCAGLRLVRTPSMTWLEANKITGQLSWATESDVQYHVRHVFKDVCASTGLGDHLQFHNELSVFGTAPDMWVMTLRGRPVGVVEVKKPGRGILGNEEVAGQMYDYLRRLRSFYGLKHAFGIATTYVEWRIFWLRDDATEAAAVACPPATLSDERTRWQAAWWQRDLGVPRWCRNDSSPLPSEPAAPPTPLRDRAVRAGAVLSYTDHCALIEMVASAFFKMLQSPAEPPSLVSRQRHYIYLTEESWLWVKLEAEFQLTPGVVPAGTAKSLLLLADLRGGIEGRLWLAATVHGAVCVIKFAKDGRADVLEHECAMWRQLWGRADVRLLRLGGQDALVMPYVYMATEEDWARPAVVAAARAAAARIDSLGLVYTDVRRRHLGLYEDEAGSLQAVFVDLSSVVRKDAAAGTAGDIRSLENMLTALELAM